jgi:hypothetical protein
MVEQGLLMKWSIYGYGVNKMTSVQGIGIRK